MIKICVIGLGYVGLPVALSISGKFNTVGYDSNLLRIQDLKNKHDSNFEFTKKYFNKKKIIFTNKPEEISNCNFYIICLPTPVDKNKVPNLKPIMNSLKFLKNKIKKNDIIILESTVYPGLTKTFSNRLSKMTKLKNDKDFFTCYSPERINPGDKNKKLKDIDKVFAINTSKKIILNKIKSVYKLISKKIIFSKYIAEAETAKAIENTQRDLNIALFNELLILSDRLNLRFSEIIRLAETKWNFLKFKPGLVGGHCLPVDPYYLSYIAKKNNFKMQVALAGRSVNNSMKKFVLNKFNLISKSLKKNSKIVVVGLSYKYGVSDLRNSLNLKIFKEIKKKFYNSSFYDPFVIYKNKINENKAFSANVIIFLSEGQKFKKLYKKMSNRKRFIICDPFRYYS